jgi:hypothetical protein
LEGSLSKKEIKTGRGLDLPGCFLVVMLMATIQAMAPKSGAKIQNYSAFAYIIEKLCKRLKI